ncbi:MAG: tetratricopeptide repeat protein [Byssovorax sp.]
MDAIWQRAGLGRHSAVLGLSVGEPPADLRVIRVSCDIPASTLGPLLEARRNVEQILDSEAPLLDQARGRVVAGLRRHLLGDLPALATDGSLVELWNRLAEHRDPRHVLLFDAVDGADESTLDMLRQILSRREWLRLPLILVFRDKAPSGAAARLVEAIEATSGPEAVIREVRGEASPSRPALPAFDLRRLPEDVLQVLRAGAVAGSGFEAELVAEVLGLDPLFVLERLQRGSDAGLPIEDRGEGRFYLPEALLAALRSSTLPSLSRALHRRFAAHLDRALGGEPVRASSRASEVDHAPEVGHAPDATPEVSPASEPLEQSLDASSPVVEPAIMPESSARPVADPPAPPDQPAAAPDQPEVFDAPADLAEALAAGEVLLNPPPSRLPAAIEPEAADPPAAQPSPPPPAEIFPEAERPTEAPPVEDAPGDKPADKAPPFTANDSTSNVVPIWFKPFGGERRGRSEEVDASFREPAAQREERRQRLPETPAPGDAARAAGHLAAAGEPEAGAERYFAAARQAAAMGAYPQAAAHDRKALALLDGLPASPRRRRLRLAILLDLGRLRWHAAGPDASFALSRALEVLEAARACLQSDDPPELAAEVAALIAGVCHDIGDLPSLTRALDELAAASRKLMSAGDALGAARLLNDQAAVYLRLGDPVRATHLLSESRKVFEERAASDPVAMVEMAETDHLFATIPLHVAARPGREADALTMGLDHAIAAERVYRKLGAPRELGRVWETMGRIELRKGRRERAMERFSSAMQVQESIGDLIGLARSTAGLAEVLRALGRHRDALGLLAESIGFNLEKGSPLGLAYNRRAFVAMLEGAPRTTELAALAAQVETRLAAAESVLGQISLPGERNAPR